ncbi:ABC transporter permease [Amycolatopsis nigrescens]|uniref:ABC transporter permease n=1 Tax=Amycolatopsis nigrescens TaxID=381445 RepID=UPI0003693D72|nr:ABC transporter permease [Amycolatopsis nigrescens]
MTLLAMERIKLFSTRSPWWCALVMVLVTVAFGTLMTLGAVDNGRPPTVAGTQAGYNFGLPVVMVLAALAVTTEYRFGTIRTTFQAVPGRTGALAAKTVVVALLALVLGELAAFGSWAVGILLVPAAERPGLALDSSADWVNVAGVGVVAAFAAVIAVAVGVLIRHSAGALVLLLMYSLLGEDLIGEIPGAGPAIVKWLPFTVADRFLTGDGASNAGQDGGFGPVLSATPLSQAGALAYFAAFALLLLGAAITVANKRDA